MKNLYSLIIEVFEILKSNYNIESIENIHVCVKII